MLGPAYPIPHRNPLAAALQALETGPMRLLRAVRIAAGVLLTLAACTPSPDLHLLDSTCQAPCWYGLLPGTTTTDEALDLISQIPGVYAESIAVRDVGDDNRHITWVMQSGAYDYYGELTISMGAVSAIALSPDGDVRLEDVLLAWGAPDLVGGFYGQGHGHWRSVFILFDEGTAVSLGDDRWLMTDTWRLRRSNEVRYIYFFEPGSLHQLVRDEPMFSPIAPDVDALIAASIPWGGYSTISLHSVR